MYGKHFASCYTGSMYGAGLNVFAVWGYVIANAKPPGEVHLNPAEVAGALGAKVEEVEAAIEYLGSPDPKSQHEEHDGRRLLHVGPGPFRYSIPSWQYYQGLRNEEERKEYNRKKQQESRDRKRHPASNGIVKDVSHGQPPSAHVDVDVDVEKANCIVPPSPPIPLLPTSATAAAVAIRTEMDWRVEEVWRAHLKQWAGFFTTVNGKVPTPTPTLTKEIRGAIRDAIAAFDKGLLGAEQRDQWKRESKARAAGIGIFFDTWCTGTDPKNNVNEGGKRFLEHWRPWKKQAGKGDPVERFSELYFEVKSRTS